MKAIALFFLLASTSMVEAIRQTSAPKSTVEINLNQTPYEPERETFQAAQLDED